MIDYRSQNHSLVRAFQAPTLRTRRESIALNRVFKTAPQLSNFFRDEEIVAQKGELDRPISGLATDSRRVVPGNLFFALPGQRADGNTFIDEAVSRGAVAVVVQKMPLIPAAKVTFIRVVDVRKTLALVSQRYYKFPDRDLTVVGITGTRGKTCVTHLLKQMLSKTERVGHIGTISYDLGKRVVPSLRTTPDALDVYGMMAQMRGAGCTKAILEVSSHGIDQHRVRGMQMGVAVFTNLSADHLDYHKTLQSYFDVKSRLFTGGTGSQPKAAVVNLDDAHGQMLAARIAAELPSVRLVTYGENPRAMVRAESLTLRSRYSTFKVLWPKGEMLALSPLVGRFNVSNVLAAVATAWVLGQDPKVSLEALRNSDGVRGRMERVDIGQPFNVIVDYAHTEDALKNALGMLRAITPGKVHVVFGCNGDRDRATRPAMMRAAQQGSDQVYVTADNPRNEPLAQIFSDMKAGVTAPEKVAWIESRRSAIEVALSACQPGDAVLIAGKGHETVQEFAGTVFPFDDRQVARELLTSKLVKL